MDCGKTGALLRRLRTERGLTQKQLAGAVGVSDKTISKWETGLGCPDVSLLGQLSEVLGVNVERILAGRLDPNDTDGGNMKRIKFYQCPTCGNILTATGDAELSCCGRKLSPLPVRPADEAHSCTVSEVEEDYYVTFPHEMTKEHFLSFAALVNSSQLLLTRLYPEQGSEVRFPQLRGDAELYLCCSRHGLWKQPL